MISQKPGEGCVVTDKSESWMHYMAKMIMHKLLRDKGYESRVEWNTGSRIIDVAQKLKNGKWLCYEMQSKGVAKKTKEMKEFSARMSGQIEDIIVIDLSKFNNNTKEMIAELKKIVV
jgi:hypothetical protein